MPKSHLLPIGRHHAIYDKAHKLYFIGLVAYTFPSHRNLGIFIPEPEGAHGLKNESNERRIACS